MDFEILEKISGIKNVAIGNSIRDIARLRKYFGNGHWKKMKGIAHVKLQDGSVSKAELHWYEAHGIGKKEFKIKKYFE